MARGGVAVVLKHLAAQGEAVGGRNGQSAVIGMHDLQEIHLEPVKAGVHAGALGFMAAYNDIDSIPCCANPWLLKTYLRQELGFNGIVMADGLAVDRLVGMVPTVALAGKAALLAGVDVSLWDEGFTKLEEFGDDEQVVQAINTSLRRVLELKSRFGLLEFQEPNTSDNNTQREITIINVADSKSVTDCIQATQEYAYTVAQRSLVLLKNQNETLNLNTVRSLAAVNTGYVIVTGPFANDFACFQGDYTAPVKLENQETIYQQLAAVLGEKRVLLAIHPEDFDDEMWRNASAIVAVVGGTSERSYASEFADNGAALSVSEFGATGGEGVDTADISLPWHQDVLFDSIKQRSNAPLLTIVVSGRAHVLTHAMEQSDMLLWAGYAGQYAAKAIVAAITSSTPIPGRLPVTLPKYAGAIPVRYNDRCDATHVYRDAVEPVLLPFGFGLGALDNCTISDFSVLQQDEILLSRLKIKAGNNAAQGALLLYAHVQGGIQVPRLAQLVASQYVMLDAHEERAITFSIPVDLMCSDGLPNQITLWTSQDDKTTTEILI